VHGTMERGKFVADNLFQHFRFLVPAEPHLGRAQPSQNDPFALEQTVATVSARVPYGTRVDGLDDDRMPN